jgi:hypothetical protein
LKEEISKHKTIEDDTDQEYIVPGKVTIENLELESKKYLDIMNDFSKERIRNKELVKQYVTWIIQHGGIPRCEISGKELRIKPNGYPIADVHHLIPFNEEVALGPDHYLNIVLISPDYHRLLHDGNLSESSLKELYKFIEINSYLKKSVSHRIEELEKLGYLYPSSIDYAKRKYMIN